MRNYLNLLSNAAVAESEAIVAAVIKEAEIELEDAFSSTASTTARLNAALEAKAKAKAEAKAEAGLECHTAPGKLQRKLKRTMTGFKIMFPWNGLSPSHYIMILLLRLYNHLMCQIFVVTSISSNGYHLLAWNTIL